LIGEQVVPNALQFQGTTVGGLSSIDYDPRTAAAPGRHAVPAARAEQPGGAAEPADDPEEL
jgi:hypothetical protein